jgi:hypothetical protein
LENQKTRPWPIRAFQHAIFRLQLKPLSHLLWTASGFT